MVKRILFTAVVAVVAFTTISWYVLREKYTCFRPAEIWNDTKGVPINCHGGGILYHKGIYYWFGEFKVEGKKGNSAQVGVSCYSSKDLYNWKNEGTVLPVVENNEQHDLAKGCILERPKVIYNAKTKKFVMWFHLELKGKGYAAARCGVAVSDKINGTYKYMGSFRPNAKIYPLNLEAQDTAGNDKDNFFKRDFEGGQMSRDMNLFVDDDGKAYHIYSSEENRTMQISLLTDDYLQPAGKYIRIFKHRQREAPAMFRRNGRYYLITSACTGWKSNAASWADADQIMGKWTEHENPCLGDNANLTFDSQSTYVLPVAGKKDAYIFVSDRWKPENAIDGRYLFLPIDFVDNTPQIKWQSEWNLSYFK